MARSFRARKRGAARDYERQEVEDAADFFSEVVATEGAASRSGIPTVDGARFELHATGTLTLRLELDPGEVSESLQEERTY